jgi:hypothetical protein
VAVFQVWDFTLLSDGAIDLAIASRAKDFLITENERLECFFKSASSALDQACLGNKARIFFCEGVGITFKTFDTDKVCGVSSTGPYFLTVRDHDEGGLSQKEKRRSYFKGRFSSGEKPVSADPQVLSSCELESGQLKILLREGAGQLILGQKQLTCGFGLYTSFHSQGIWYDSAQAKWRVEVSSKNKVVAHGLWPWKAVSQRWEITLEEGRNVFLKFHMRVSKTTSISMQETALMLSDAYQNWRADGRSEGFPKAFTKDDFFRVCLWSGAADGKQGVSAFSQGLPGVMFKPSLMDRHELIVENSAHIFDTPCRLFHCLRVNKGEGVVFPPGNYEFFNGMITVNGEETK